MTATTATDPGPACPGPVPPAGSHPGLSTPPALHVVPRGAGATEPQGDEPSPTQRTSPRRHLHVVPSPAPTAHAVPDDAARTARATVRGIVEALAGLRPVAHLAPGCDLPSYEKLRRRVRWERELGAEPLGQAGPVTARQQGRASRRNLRVLSTHTQACLDAVEASATFCLGGQVRAFGFRMEPHRGRWRITAVDFG